MRKTLIKIGIIAGCFLFPHLTFAKNVSKVKTNNPSLAHIRMLPKATCTSFQGYSFAPMLALQTLENLKAYHFGLKFINPMYHIPDENDLLETIYSHSMFIGELPDELAQESALLTAHEKSYCIFVTYKDRDEHFYLVHPKGIRHFTIEPHVGMETNMASILNGSDRIYPSLNAFKKDSLRFA